MIEKGKQKGIVGVLVAVIAVILVIAIAFWLFSAVITENPAIEVSGYKIEPDSFKETESCYLSFKVRNLKEERVDLKVYFETIEIADIFLGNNRLPLEGGNYTYTKTLDPSEETTLTFPVQATLEVGDNDENFHVKGYFYADGDFVTSKQASTIVKDASS